MKMCFKKNKPDGSYLMKIELAKETVAKFKNKSAAQTTKILIQIASVDQVDIQYLLNSKKDENG